MKGPSRTPDHDIERAFAYAQQQKERGSSESSLIPDLKEQGCTILDSIKVLRHVYGTGLADAKSIVTSHPVWQREARRMDRLHQAILDALEND